ncbi:MAG: cytochrome c oxidase subunit II [Rickettsiales bacterium]|jgi:cytochrome c oxidase subunit II|nr:cytochrome c oxidase subunit II [Rickettsiales bacterium]
MTKTTLLFLSFITSLLIAPGLSMADGIAKPWQMGFQAPASPLASAAIETHNYIMLFMFAVLFFVLILIAYTCYRFKASNNPVPSTRTHHVFLEIIWIVIPTVIIVLVAIPSVELIYKQEVIPKTEMTLKVTGNQWYWSYEYPDFDSIAFDSYMLKDDELKEGDLRLLEVDNAVVLPVETYIDLHITSSDVMHSFALPSLGVKMDAVPGRLNHSWLYIEKPGVYFGQCSELCGAYHAFMPIKIRAVTKEEFKKWLIIAQQQFTSLDSPNNLHLASNR